MNVDFGQRVASLDLDLFRHIEAELTDDDKRSLLAIQSAIREKRESFCYLEIGSHLGGSIQPYLLDSKCTAIISIDKRTNGHSDGRSVNAALSDASTASMLTNLERISAADCDKCSDSSMESSRRSKAGSFDSSDSNDTSRLLRAPRVARQQLRTIDNHQARALPPA